MTPQELHEVGVALFGEKYRAALARLLGVSKRRLMRMVAGKAPIPDGFDEELTHALSKLPQRFKRAVND